MPFQVFLYCYDNSFVNPLVAWRIDCSSPLRSSGIVSSSFDLLSTKSGEAFMELIYRSRIRYLNLYGNLQFNMAILILAMPAILSLAMIPYIRQTFVYMYLKHLMSISQFQPISLKSSF